ncbi:hypothetical protein Btru_044246 [Bulinus truncatus]|nr:hypothetical protein Btru_044246 [Bulinus truncatus]
MCASEFGDPKWTWRSRLVEDTDFCWQILAMSNPVNMEVTRYTHLISLSLSLLTLCAVQADKPKTDQEKEDWVKMEEMVQKEINKMKAKYNRGGSETCQAKQTMNAQMLTPTPEGQDFEDVYRAHMCTQCKDVSQALEKGMVSADKRKRYGRHLSDDEIVELSYKICEKKVEDFKSFCKEIVQKSESVFYDRYLAGPDYGLTVQVCKPYCEPTQKKDEL